MSNLRLERAGSPSGWKRILFRAPVPIYRARLGFIFGHRFVMLCHTGRKTGETRRTILEVVVNDSAAVYVAAAWGAKAQWLKNVQADPAVVFYLGPKKYPTRAHLVSNDEARDVMHRYVTAHPRTLDKLARFMLDDPGETSAEQAERVALSVPIVRLPKTQHA